MLCALAVAALFSALNVPPPDGKVTRDDFGIPSISARSLADAFFWQGYAVAEDRLWQMELSRRLARGKLSQLLGRTAVNSDKDILRFGYTDSEYESIYRSFDAKTREALDAYCSGVNHWIETAASEGRLPAQFASQKPTPWTRLDSLAITVNMVRQFGRGGAGEIRNLLLLTYMKDRLGDATFDALDDLLWISDPDSIPTCMPGDDPHKGKSPFSPVPKDSLKNHAALLPKVNLLELLPGIRIMEQAEAREIAAELGLPNKWGSYAVLIAPQRSKIGAPILMNGPQMGFQTPSIVHQTSISCPEYQAVGMEVPGIPGVVVGHSKTLAWGLTSGVADTDDVFFVRLNPKNPDEYSLNGKWVPFKRTEVPIEVKDGAQETAIREMSAFGPVILKSTGTGVAYVRKSSLWLGEPQSIEYLYHLPQCRTIEEVGAIARKMTASFNLFAATSQGDIGWFFVAKSPIRSPEVDPRLPAPAEAKYDWKGFVPPSKMPYVINPKQGWIANWNNKPVAWWPNMDTPTWGVIFRNENLVRQLEKAATLDRNDVVNLAKTIAMKDITGLRFISFLEGARSRSLSPVQRAALEQVLSWTGSRVEGTVPATIYQAYYTNLQRELCEKKLGAMFGNFTLAVQASLVYRALRGETKTDFLEGRSAEDVAFAAFLKAVEALEKSRGADVTKWKFAPGRIDFRGMPPVLYNERGTYIQVVELLRQPVGWFIAPPGSSEDEASPHFSDQRDLAAAWRFIPMRFTSPAR